MEEKGYIERNRILEVIFELECDVRQERTDLDMKYDEMKLTLDSLDETLIRLDGQLEMIGHIKNHLKMIDPVPIPPSECH